MRTRLFVILSSLVLTLSGCASVDPARTASDLAAQGSFSVQDVRAGRFVLRTQGRIAKPGAPLTVYIEGDGFAWATRYQPSDDPTPRNPAALRLAALDPAPNVVHIARPCQYVRAVNAAQCDVRYWTSHRLAPDVIASISAAIDAWQAKSAAQSLRLVGFSGGGAVALLVAAGRSDVVEVRTIAGNLDHALLNRLHGVDQMTGSLNAVDVARDVARIPQVHYVGSDDKIVLRAVTESYVQRAGAGACIAVRSLAGASHEGGWAEAWPTLLTEPAPSC